MKECWDFKPIHIAQILTPILVKGRILHLLGGIARYQPSVLNDGNIKSFLRWAITTLTHQLFQEQNADTNLITGAMRGLDNYLFQFYNVIQQSKGLYDIDPCERHVLMV
jgi:hypothetical protein